MSTPVTVTNLPVITEITSGDLLIVQTPAKTGALKFDDFVIGEEHVSFYKDIQDIATDVQLLSSTIQPYISQLGGISSLQQEGQSNTATLSNIQSSLNDINDKIDDLNVQVASVSGTINGIISRIEDLEARPLYVPSDD